MINIQISSSPTMELSELTSINSHAIDLVGNKQTLYSPVYKLGGARNSGDLNQDLANASIRPSKSTSLEEVNLWIAWAIPHVVFHPVDQTDAYHGKKTRKSNNLKTAFRTRNGQLEYQTMDLPILLSGLRQ